VIDIWLTLAMVKRVQLSGELERLFDLPPTSRVAKSRGFGGEPFAQPPVRRTVR
jgi:hypothetical protein